MAKMIEVAEGLWVRNDRVLSVTIDNNPDWEVTILFDASSDEAIIPPLMRRFENGLRARDYAQQIVNAVNGA